MKLLVHFNETYVQSFPLRCLFNDPTRGDRHPTSAIMYKTPCFNHLSMLGHLIPHHPPSRDWRLQRTRRPRLNQGCPLKMSMLTSTLQKKRDSPFEKCWARWAPGNFRRRFSPYCRSESQAHIAYDRTIRPIVEMHADCDLFYSLRGSYRKFQSKLYVRHCFFAYSTPPQLHLLLTPPQLHLQVWDVVNSKKRRQEAI